MTPEQTLEAILAVVNRYLPPDGIPIKDAMAEIVRLVDPPPELDAAEKDEPAFWSMPDGKIVDKWGLQFYRGVEGTPLYTHPQPRKPLTFPQEAAAFKEWFDAWWIGDGEQGEEIPSIKDRDFNDYTSLYTLGFGAWMAAKHNAHGIKEST